MNAVLPFVWAFLVGGAICVVGQLMFDVLKLTPAHTMVTLVVIGAILDGVGLYDPLIEFAGAGATVPITSFGNQLTHGALTELGQTGWAGLFGGVYHYTSAGITAAIVFSFFAALLARPKG
ncbi:stage V sporulation protein AE [Paenibacillus thermotolerans]|uniref:stage V sporulation protein AE n=1 Tax=Paenibacillus thermotolerans TaxID=3027807 RepID=UPI00236893CD|nr:MULTISPECIES: stage V sporulation protein AE [unclassified Paenibacillus]